MKRAFPSDSIFNRTDKSVLERQRDLLKHHDQFDQTDYSNFDGFLSDPIDGSMGPEPGYENWCSGFGFGSLQVSYGSVTEAKETPAITSDTSKSKNFMKRKLENVQWVDASMEERNNQEKKNNITKVEEDEEEKSKITEEKIVNIKSITKKKKVTKEQQNSSNDSSKSDYIHVRARRGQATDSHSIAERVRREKISERMKFLQDLVPGCNKITGKAGMLDEIINYVQSLQSQIEFLSMKLATVSPRFHVEPVDDIFGQPVIPEQTNFTNVEMVNSGYLQLNPMQQVLQSSGTGLTTNTTGSDPIWDLEMQNVYSNLGFDQWLSPLTTFTNSQPFSGSKNTNNLKIEM